MARIPEKSVSVNDKANLAKLEPELKKVIYGQDAAIESIVSAIKLSRAGLGVETKPIGSYLFSGPTGVGKTELARQLARVLGVELLRFASIRAACSPTRCARRPTRCSCSTRSRRRTRMCSTSCSRSWTTRR
jgi:DNA polymerase III delta prime subunit